MIMKRVNSQMQETSTSTSVPVYWLMDIDNSIRSADTRSFPLSLLDNNYILETKLLEGSDQVKFLIDACQQPDKISNTVADDNIESHLYLECNEELKNTVTNGLESNSLVSTGTDAKVTSNLPANTVLQKYDACQQPDKISNTVADDNIESHLYLECNEELKNTVTNGLESNSLVSTGTDAKVTSNLPANTVLQKYVDIPDNIVPPRALAVLPTILQIRRDVISPRRALPTRARFGPVQGIKNTIKSHELDALKLESSRNKTPLFLLQQNNNIIHIDVSDKDKSNWIGLLPLGDDQSANIWIHEENNALYAITTETVTSRKPLKLGYSQKYALCYGISGPTKDIDALYPIKQNPWWCKECQRMMPSAYILQRHIVTYHKDDYAVPRRKYRCRQCSRTFSRLFTLRRHMITSCTKKASPKEEKSEISVNEDPEPQANLSAILNSEDNRIPSDESFQNYSNGLDFSTNLFDTDRMPSLDISIRSEGEFDPYSIGYKDDNSLTNVLGPTQNESNEQKKVEPILETCSYCNEVVVKEKKSQHARECAPRRFQCECKKVFRNKELLSNHVFTQHSSEGKIQEKKDEESSKPASSEDNKPFKCDQCQRAFKRRGMLVNHLWQIHKTVSVAPLERRIRHYPCVACAKIYRTAAKRDRHVGKHHPEAASVRGRTLEGGTRLASAAACGVCPRQYATRAKMLQHQRQHHPHLAHLHNKKVP